MTRALPDLLERLQMTLDPFQSTIHILELCFGRRTRRQGTYSSDERTHRIPLRVAGLVLGHLEPGIISPQGEPHVHTTMTRDVQRRPEVGRFAMIAGTFLAFAGTFLYRFLTVDFTNDHFQHLARGRQILLGEVPIRDFFDPGLIGQYYASAAALAWSGHNLYGEALLTVGFIAAGAAVTFTLSARLSRSFWIALAATFLVAISGPRLYSYPKVFFYVLALASAWRYAHRPSNGSLALLAAITVIAFYFRHDHGIYIGLSALALLTILHWSQPLTTVKAITRYAVYTLVLLAPYLAFVQMSAGLYHYVTGLTPQVQHVSTPRLNLLPVKFDPSAPLVIVSPPPERRVNVRWGPTVDEATRRARESRYGLTNPLLVEGSTWSYAAADERRQTIRAIVDDPLVADTHGIDRQKGELAVRELLVEKLQRWLPPLRTSFAPGVFTRENALAWLYYVSLIIPLIGLLTLVWLLWHGEIARPEAAVAGMATLLGIIIVQTLVRGSPDSRMADVAAPISVLGAWITSRWLRPGSARAVRRVAALPAVLAFWLVTVWSAGTDAYAGQALTASRILTGPAGILWKWNVTSERLKARPIDNWERKDPGVRGLGRYVFECTTPEDRILITWFQPEIFFFAERRFAGGQVYLQPRWHASLDDQRLTVERMKRQRVPIVLVRDEREPYFRGGFPIVYDYVQARYRKASANSDQIAGFQVLVDRQIMPTGTYDQLGLPCYRSRASSAQGPP